MRQTMVAAAVALLALPAAAQQGGASPAAAAEGQLRPVVVTPGLGTARPAFDIPASVDVLPGSVLRQDTLGINLSESLARVPGITALNRQNYAQDIQISSRGYGARSTFGVRGLRLYTDGIPATAPDGQSQVSHFDLYSADRLEVLRGPFSALHGNSSGGVISLYTADGGPETVAEISGAIGSDSIRRVNARLSGQQGAWQYALSATHFETEGARDWSSAQRRGFNGKFKYNAGPDTTLTLVLNQFDMPEALDPLGLTRAEFEADPHQASPVARPFRTRKAVDQLQLGAILDHRLDAANALRFTTWRGQRGTEQYQAIPTATQVPITQPGGVIDLQRDYRGLDAQWVHATRLAGAPFTVTAGLYADELQEHRLGFQNFTGPATAPTALGVRGALRRDEDNRARTVDQYVEGVWSGERFSLTAGLRHSRVAFRSSDHFIVGANGDDSGDVTYGATTPVLGVVWHASEALNLYASAGRGFETPTLNELANPPGGSGLNTALRPADSRQWELGAKARLGERWHLNAAVFQARTSDEIVVLSNSGGRSTFQNAGHTGRHGFELSAAGPLGGGWSTAVAATWLQARYDDSFLTCGPPPCTTPTVLVPAGNRIPGIPSASLFAELAWQHRPWGLEAAAEVRHTGRIAVDDRNTDFAAASTILSLRAALAQPVGRWTMREFLRVDNVADKRYAGSVIVNEGNGRYFEPAPGRTWLLGATAIYIF
jgi:iron complex outermembrane receptor protein